MQTVADSYVGLRLVLLRGGSEIVLTAFTIDDPRQVTTSLRLPLSLLDECFEEPGHIVFYAEQPAPSSTLQRT